MMEEARFKTLAEAYGGDIARWPDADQASARAFQAAHPERAEAVLHDALVLDRALAGAGPVDTPSCLEGAILAQTAQEKAGLAPAPPPWAALAAAVALTVGLGAGWFAVPEQDPYADPAFAEAFGSLENDDVFETLAGEEAR
jgi:hypothetical protein